MLTLAIGCFLALIVGIGLIAWVSDKKDWLMKIFAVTRWRMGKEWGFWFRIFGYGLVICTLQPLFSERNDYTKVWRIGRVKIKVLKP